MTQDCKGSRFQLEVEYSISGVDRGPFVIASPPRPAVASPGPSGFMADKE